MAGIFFRSCWGHVPVCNFSPGRRACTPGELTLLQQLALVARDTQDRGTYRGPGFIFCLLPIFFFPKKIMHPNDDIEDAPLKAVRKDKRSVCCKRLSNALIFVLIFGALFGVLLWDMRKVHMLSEIIHDDHTNHWMQIDNAALKWWLSPLDICMLNATEPMADLYSYKSKNCSKLVGSKGSAALHFSCSIGASIGGKVCHAPLASRTFFTSQLKDPIMGNASNLLLRTTLRELAHQNKPIIFVGDGISKQNQEALLCEIMRTDSVVLTGATGAVDGNYTITWRHDRSLKLDIHYLKLTNMYDNGENEGLPKEPESKSQRKKLRRAAAAVERSIVSPENNTDYSDAEWKRRFHRDNTTTRRGARNSTTTTKPVKVPLSLTLGSIQERVENLLNRSRNGVVLIFNVGVWYNSRELFRKELPDLLSWMNLLSIERNSTVLFRETAAQHWNHTTSGYFNLDYMHTRVDNGTCTPIADATPGNI